MTKTKKKKKSLKMLLMEMIQILTMKWQPCQEVRLYYELEWKTTMSMLPRLKLSNIEVLCK
jgi:hypothetical protein